MECTRFIELAGEVNASMPFYVVDKLSAGLNKNRKSIKGAISLLGSLIKETLMIRESPQFGSNGFNR